jgi:hypothetical protein
MSDENAVTDIGTYTSDRIKRIFPQFKKVDLFLSQQKIEFWGGYNDRSHILDVLYDIHRNIFAIKFFDESIESKVMTELEKHDIGFDYHPEKLRYTLYFLSYRYPKKPQMVAMEF